MLNLFILVYRLDRSFMIVFLGIMKTDDLFDFCNRFLVFYGLNLFHIPDHFEKSWDFENVKTDVFLIP